MTVDGISTPAGRAESARREEILGAAAALIGQFGLRVTLQQITDAADILPGSLYHHFRSKDDILVELLRRFHADLDRLGEQTERAIDAADYRPGAARVVELCEAVAECAARHRAAVQISLYEAPSTSPELIELVVRRPDLLHRAVLDTLRAVRWSGGLRDGQALPDVADLLCQTMLHVGLDVVQRRVATARVVDVLAATLLGGLARSAPADDRLDASAALAAAQAVVRHWLASAPDVAPDTAARVRSAARAEFARRGFETTSLRDIAAAAGVGVGTVHRLIGSKEELLSAVMRSFGERMAAGRAQVLATDSGVVEKLDAMMWLNINALVHFPDEFRIQLAWMRQSPRDVEEPAWLFTRRLTELRALLAEGISSGELVGCSSLDLLTRCVVSLLWIPEGIVTRLGAREALLLGRATLLRGIADRSTLP